MSGAASPGDDRGNHLPRAHGPAVLAARIRATPEDFRVDELPGFEPSGSGEHLLLEIEKRGMNTAFAARHIAAWAGVPESAIGYAGLKDRHAVTRQRFSVHLPRRVAPDSAGFDIEGEPEYLRLLRHDWHSRKLPRGALAGNRFVLVLRDAQGDRAAVEARLQAMAARGVPNYFGEQRFGRGGDNLTHALAMFAGRRVGREQRGLLLSAARSAAFNRVLAARVEAGDWDTGMVEGEVWMLDGSRSVFGPEPLDAALAARVAAFDIHPTGPLWGRGELRSAGRVAALEHAMLADGAWPRVRDGLEKAGLKQERRALRLRPDALAWAWPSPDTLRLEFALPPGTYATVVLAELGDFNGT
ncbi:tRNA pseudouridine(13) synthase TruD [Novilysobacter arseniciresistens]|uniref:tRNA pseudouridine(13) synthase TruD n=1 Tax=Novilysobacter arseniciresistens TaxID=1385522 RepID=UPI00068B032B|nr:tRNA pseudouridine(13) synthase TruD [Lysobacter arseniciresistens]